MIPGAEYAAAPWMLTAGWRRAYAEQHCIDEVSALMDAVGLADPESLAWLKSDRAELLQTLADNDGCALFRAKAQELRAGTGQPADKLVPKIRPEVRD